MTNGLQQSVGLMCLLRLHCAGNNPSSVPRYIVMARVYFLQLRMRVSVVASQCAVLLWLLPPAVLLLLRPEGPGLGEEDFGSCCAAAM